MATGWVKSLRCKSSAYRDVAHSHAPKKPLLPLSSSCSNSSQALRDVVCLFPKHPPLPKKPPESTTAHHPHRKPPRPKPKHRRVKPKQPKPACPGLASPSPDPAGPAALFPTLTELPAGHSSRRVVEIIFGSSWHDRGSPFPGRIEMIFRVHNPTRTVARFEEYRSSVRSRSGGGDARCAADGNEMMRFHCAPSSASAAGDGIYDASVASCAVTESSPDGDNTIEEGIPTFAGSGGAHESAGGGSGRRSMLVCRVIAGRVRIGPGPESSFESVCGSGKGELIVFDPRAVLPCFLIIYTI